MKFEGYDFVKVFYVILFGQLVSRIGSYLSVFALKVWIYENTNSIGKFALTSLFLELPGLFLCPVAGIVVDRVNKRKLLILTDVIALITNVALGAIIFFYGHNPSEGNVNIIVYAIYLVGAINSITDTFQGNAFAVTMSILLPKEMYAKGDAMCEIGSGICQLVAPGFSGLLMATLGLNYIISIDTVTCLFAIFTLCIVRFPKLVFVKPDEPEKTEPTPSLSWKDLLKTEELTFGWHYIKSRPGLLSLLLLFTYANFVDTFINELLPPFLLSFATVEELGYVASFCGVGMLVGAVVVSVFGVPDSRKIPVILVLVAVQGCIMLSACMSPSTILIGSVGFLFLMLDPIISGCSSAIWMSKVPVSVQGRVFSFRGIIAGLSSPLVWLGAGFLTDSIFEPAMQPGGVLAETVVGGWFGTGPGKGICLLWFILGVSLVVASLVSYCNPRLRKLEIEIPDHNEQAQTKVEKLE